MAWPAVGIGAESTSATAGGFSLASGDMLKFDILDDDREPVDLMVASDGTIQAPFLGAVPVAGMSIVEAREHLKSLYADQKIFVAPQIGLSVAAYRPVFVIGDVRQPGAYPFQADLTVEKAMSLAGGQLLAGQGEDPVLARARLQGDLAKTDTAIAREALAIARLTAQLADRETIAETDVPEDARGYLTGALADTMRGVEQRILDADLKGFAGQQAVLRESIAEGERGQQILEELRLKVNSSIEMSRADLERGRGLQQRGIKTLTDVSNLERQLNAEESRQLQVLSELSQGRQDLAGLRKELAVLEQTRDTKALNELQAHTAELAAQIATRRTTEEQISLITALSVAKLKDAKEVVVDFTIRRNGKDGVKDIQATAASAVEPGDVVAVSIRSKGLPLSFLQPDPVSTTGPVPSQ
jgi:exopolysaccharide production protein ExoF